MRALVREVEIGVGAVYLLCLFVGVAAAQGVGGEVQTKGGSKTASAKSCDPNAAVDTAMQLHDQGKSKRAVEVLEGCLASLERPSSKVLFAICRLLHETDKDQEALSYCEKAVRTDPNDPSKRRFLADLYLTVGHKDSALAEYHEVLRLRPNDMPATRRMGELLLWMDRPKEAAGYLRRYLKVVPTDLEARKMLYDALLWSDQPKEAVRVLEQIVQETPEDLKAKKTLAERYLDLGMEQKAIQTYEDLLRQNPKDGEARLNLAKLYEWNDMPDKALEQYEAYLELRPYDEEARKQALELAMALGKGTLVQEHASALSAMDPKYSYVAKELLLEEWELGTSAGVHYLFFADNLKFQKHIVGPVGNVAVNDWLTLGAFYNFLYLLGPPPAAGIGQPNLAAPRTRILAHQGGLRASMRFPGVLSVDAAAYLTRYDTGFLSGSGYLELRKTLGAVTLSLRGERADMQTTIGDIEREVVENRIGLYVYAEPLSWLILYSGFYYGRLSDTNNHVYGEAQVGFKVLNVPRLVLSYNYLVDHFSFTDSTQRTYFNPRIYQMHGPQVVFRHPVTTYFLYGAKVALWHAVEDSALLLSYGPELVLRIKGRHHLKASYQRMDTVYGSAAVRYQQNVFRFSYMFQF